ncbi:unnamed protein product [Cylindrotheca closterium]|uniref:PPIase cyclophilin-type domain-containing protein n=1 Tax=Cylindrotheca closterium TaxID=2856 RepID=A0AAD2GBX2_9STRA|nr:unnamed protein product [Cylindrotheca closterium]
MVNPMEEAIVRCKTTAGTFTLKLNRIWSPNGYDRAVELFERKFYDGSHFFRVVKGFLVQFGISYSEDKELQKFAKSTIKDDPPKGIKFKPGTMSFAGSGDNSRTSHLFISYGSAQSLGREKWETPIGEVIEGMEHVESFYSYGDMPPWGKGPVQGKIYSGRSYIEDNFPKTDSFIRCRTERLNTVDDDDDKIVLKSDHKTDEENFAASLAKQEAGAIGKLRLNSPLKNIQDGNGDSLILIAVIICFLLGLLFVVLRLLSNRKNKAAKTS